MKNEPARRSLRPSLMAAFGLFLVGCTEVEALMETEIIVRRRLEYRPGVSEVYCYHTLAAVDCYARPQPGPPNRLINGYGPEDE